MGKYLWVVMKGIPETDAFIMCHEYFPNKELYSTKGMVNITKEVPEEYLLDLGIPSLDSSIDSAEVPPEEGVYRLRYKEEKEIPLPILPSGSRGIIVTEANITMLRREGIKVDD